MIDRQNNTVPHNMAQQVMCIDLDKATQLALDHAAREYRESVAISHIESPDWIPYGFEPEGWDLFSILVSNSTGGGFYIAVNRKTGEARSFAGDGE
jgi:hypothetical protein